MPFTLFLKFLKCIGFLCAALNAWRSLGISCDFSQLPSSQFHIYTQGYVYRASQRMLDDLICEDIASLSLNFWILSYWFYHDLTIQEKNWMMLVQKICPKLQQMYKKGEDGLVRG